MQYSSRWIEVKDKHNWIILPLSDWCHNYLSLAKWAFNTQISCLMFMYQINVDTKMHSSMMRTVRCSGRLGRGGGCVSQHAMGQTPTPTVDRILDTRLWKYYLSQLLFRTVTSIFLFSGMLVCNIWRHQQATDQCVGKFHMFVRLNLMKSIVYSNTFRVRNQNGVHWPPSIVQSILI